jgi:ABC-type Zn2+ transport system substrate-binding protein/surface adhesin
MVAELDTHTHSPSTQPSSSQHQHSKAHYESKHPHHHHHHHPTSPTHGKAENLVLKVLKANPGENRTFGENLIFILNRLSESGGCIVGKMAKANMALPFQTVAAKKQAQKISVSRF